MRLGGDRVLSGREGPFGGSAGSARPGGPGGFRRPEDDPPGTSRLFIAVPVADDVRAAVGDLMAGVARASIEERASGQPRWVRVEGLHLTLRFLGEIGEEQKTALSRMLRDVCATAVPMQLAVEGIGAFPNPRRPAVVWAGIRVVMGDLAGLQQRIEQAARDIGLGPDNKAFHPHVTLARIRDLAASGGLAKAVAERADGEMVSFGDEFQTAAVALFRSELKSGGPVHTRLEEFPLSCKPCS